MEKFCRLSVEKQNIITNAALKSFGTNGYKKSSISDIAIAAGISKAMIFHYFGTKRALYLYLMELCGNLLITEMDEKFDNTVTDFFGRVLIATNIKITIMKKHPQILSFLTSMYFEDDEEVKAEIQANIKKGEEFRSKITVDSKDASKFKDGIDPKFVMKMFGWLSEGYINQLSSKAGLVNEALFKEFDEFSECIELFKNNFYKEEYLP